MNIVAFCRVLATQDAVLRRLAFQLVDSAGSIGANLQEGAAGESKRDFVHKLCIALKEAQESRYWLRVIAASEPSAATRARPLTAESNEIVAMLVASIKTARSRPDRGDAEDEA